MQELKLERMLDHDKLWFEVYDRAIRRDAIRSATFLNSSFNYALISSKDRYGRLKKSTCGKQYSFNGFFTDICIDYSISHNQVGFSFSDGNSSYLFVLKDCLEDISFADFVALHEHVEAGLISKPDKIKHGIACKFELNEVLRQDGSFVEKYAAWLLKLAYINRQENYFVGAIPKFFESINPDLNPVDILHEFKRQLDSEIHLFPN